MALPNSTPLRLAATAALALAILALAAALRLDGLGQHPLHADEAVQGIKLETFLQEGHFDYDPTEYHGPLPHYLSRTTLGLLGQTPPLTDANIRLAPALVGVIVVALLGGLACIAWGPAPALATLLLAAVSPALVYYSRYYIAEIFLVAGSGLFLIGTAKLFSPGTSPVRLKPWFWAALAGVGAGLMHASKETSALSFAVAALAATAAYGPRSWPWKHLIVGLAAGALTSVYFYSDAFRHWPDVWESITTYARYLNRAEGEGHQQPWWFYLQRYGYSRGGYRWGEGGILLLGLVGYAAAWARKNRHAIFLGTYALLLAALYTALPYKTPWSILPAFIAWVPLAGSTIALSPKPPARLAALVLLLAVALHLGVQTRRATHQMPTDPRNPYAYVHTAPGAMTLIGFIDALGLLAQDGIDILIADPWMAWPLPWYLRDNDKVLYRQDLPDTPKAALTIAAATALPETLPPAWSDHHSKIFSLRADLPLVAFIKPELWQAYLDSRR